MLYFVLLIDRDAAWEIEENAYSELLERYEKCDAENCICPKGRDYHKKDS